MKQSPLLINQISFFNFSDLKIVGSGYEKTNSHKQPTNSKNNASCFTIHCVLSGSGYIVVDGKQRLIEKNHIFVSFPDQDFVYWPTKVSPWKYAWMNFTGIKAVELLSMIGITAENPVIKVDDPTIPKLFLNNAVECGYNSKYSQFIALGYFYNIFAKFLKQLHSEEKTVGATPDYINKATEYINANYWDFRLNLNVVAAYVSISPSYFSKKFKKETNQNFSDYLLLVRMQNAIQLLNTTDLTVREIADKCGFSDPYYFSNTFKKLNHCSPTDHRNRIKRNTSDY